MAAVVSTNGGGLAQGGLQFFPANHEYTYNGEPIPSVTQALKAAGLVDYSNIPEDILEYAADRGTAVHAACQYWDEGDLNLDSLDPAIIRYVVAWKNFRERHPFDILAAERIFLGKLDGLLFGATLDRLVEFDGRPTIIDIKTSSRIEDWHGVQTAGYACALESTGSVSERLARYRRLVVQLKPDCSYQLHECEDAEDGVIFRAALHIAHWKMRA